MAAVHGTTRRPHLLGFAGHFTFSMCHVKENTELSRKERDNFTAQIENLKPCTVRVDDINVRVRFEMQLTLVDGKMANALTNTASAQTCHMCGATPK